MKGKSSGFSTYERGKNGLVCGDHKKRPKGPLPPLSKQQSYADIKRRSDEYEEDYWRNKLGRSL